MNMSEEIVVTEESEACEQDFDCQFLPIRILDNVIDKYSQPGQHEKNNCTKNLVQLQIEAITHRPPINKLKNWPARFNFALSKAIYAQDWDKLLRLLKLAPIWEHYNIGSINHMDNYLKALVILLMYHPSAKTRSLMDDFFHMVLSLRSEEDKKAFMKLLVSIPDKFVLRFCLGKSKYKS